MALEVAMKYLEKKAHAHLVPSMQKVIEVVDKEGPLSSSEIIEKVEFSTRAVRYALKHLVEYEILEKAPYLPDMRKTMYKISKKIEEMKAEMHRTKPL